MSTVQFWILVGNELFISPKIDKSVPLAILYKHLKADTEGPAEILVNAKIGDCKVYSVNSRVPASGEPDKVVKACFDASNDWVPVYQTTKIRDLVKDEEYLTFDYVCLIIEPPRAKHERAVNELKKRKFSALFESLQIILQRVDKWSRDDVLFNLKDGRFSRHGERRPSAMSDQEDSLAAKRTYANVQTDSGQGALDYQTASAYQDHLDKYFMLVNTRSHVVRNTREFITFFAVLRSHTEDVKRISDEPSSAFKAGYLSSHYLVPPFFSCQPQNSKTTFKADMPWKFPVMLATRNEPSNWGKTHPKSDFSVISDEFLCPFMLCEVISEKDESDRWRMLLQAIVAARVGYHLQKSHTRQKPISAVAIYLRANLTAERYIVMQTGSDGKVSIAQTDFDLLESDRALDFLREMFNLQGRMAELLQNLDDEKKDALKEIADVARDLPSLTAQRDSARQTRTRNSMQSIHEDPHERGEGARQNPFTDDPDIVERLDNMGYKLDMVLFGFEHVAMISHKSNEFDRGFLKITRRRKEVEILQYLAGIDAPDNHTILGVRTWARNAGGFVVYMSSGGGHLTALRQPDEHMWSAATQLIEGMAFMHKHGVAHRDIKPANVLIPPNGGRLSIIDFSIAVFAGGNRCCDMVGTEEFMAPEVLRGDEYDAICADLWSCGKTLQELCSRCGPSMQATFLADISRALTAFDPLQRPTMQEVLNQMVAFESSLSGPRPQIRLSTPLVIAEARS